MNSNTVLELLESLESAGVEVWIDGGWGIDALIRQQTRGHDDLDVVVALDDVDRIKGELARLGFRTSEDELPIRFVLTHSELGNIDFHTVTFDDEGGGLQPQPSGKTFRYPPEGFVTGSIAGHTVRCISADVQVLCHLGYEPKDKDLHNMRMLHDHLGIALPEPYDGLTDERAV